MLTEKTTILEITVLPAEGNIQVLTKTEILRDDEMISANNHYELYSANQKEKFLADVPNGQSYVDAVGW